MAMDVRNVFIIGIAAYVFTAYYLEKNYEREEIFWIYSILSAVLGIFSAYTVISDHPSRSSFIPLTALSITLAILYYSDTDEVEEKAVSKKG